MPHKVQFIAVLIDTETHLFAAKYRAVKGQSEYAQRQHDCLRCAGRDNIHFFTIIQNGFEWDRFDEVAYCPHCLTLSIYTYEVGENA